MIAAAGDEGGARVPLAFLDRALATFESAAGAAGAIVHHYRIGASILELRFAGPALVPIIAPAFAHLATAAAPASFTVHLFDSRSTATPMPPPPWAASDYGPRGEIQGYNDARVRTVFSAADRRLWMADLARGRAVFWTPDATTLPIWERGAPLRTLLHWWTSRDGRQLVHGAGVGTPAGGALLAGRGGSGKSTAALACLGSALRYAGDDYLLIEPGTPPRVQSLYATAKLEPAHLARRLPELGSLAAAAGGEGEKTVLDLHAAYPAALIDGFPLRALLLAVVTGEASTRVRPASAAASLAALAPTTVFQLPGDGAEAFARLSALVRHVPSYRLELGTDLAAIPDAIAGVLASSR